MDGNTVRNGQVVPNSSFGNYNTAGSPVISSGTGDIILTLGRQKDNKKKWLAITVIILFMVALVMGIASMIVGSKDNGDTGSDEQPGFNRMLNYFISNTESNANVSIDELMSPASYALTALDDGDANYFKKLREEVIEFSEMYFTEENEDNDERMRKLLYFCELGTVETITDEEIMNIYIASGKNAVIERLSSLTAVQTPSEEVTKYIAAKKEMENITLILLDMLNEAGCIRGGEIDSACGSTVQGYQAYLDDYGANYGTTNSIVIRMKSDALNALIGLYSEIYNVNFEAMTK